MSVCDPRYKASGDHTLISLDPGKRHAGVAVWRVTSSPGRWLCELRAAHLVQHTNRIAEAVRETVEPLVQGREVWAVERMQRYRGKLAKDRALDALESMLLDLRGAKPRGAGWVSYPPRVWKGQVAKRAHHMRIVSKLTDSEMTILGKHQADKWDAVALGLFALGRVGKGGV